MRTLPSSNMLLAVILASLVPFALNRELRQTTRAEVLERQLRRMTSPLRPRQSGSSLPCPPSGSPPSQMEATDLIPYTLYYSGSGQRENSVNPGSIATQYGPVTQTFDNTDIATAVLTCANFAQSQQTTQGYAYESFDLAYLKSICTWSCVAYPNINNNPYYFNVPDSDVALGYGYYILSTVPCPPSGSPPSPVEATDLIPYSLYYSGSGERENYDNPGNNSPGLFDPQTLTIVNEDIATAAETCATFAQSQQTTQGYAYWSFDLAYLKSTCSWSCVAFFDNNNDPSYFNVPNSDVALGYGYNILSTLPCSPSGSPPSPVQAPDSTTYYEYYSGSGERENYDNPGNNAPGLYDPVTLTFGNTDISTAVQTCANFAQSQQTAQGYAYWSFDLAYLKSMCQWSCVAFLDANNDPSYFNVPNSDVALGYGYSTTCPPPSGAPPSLVNVAASGSSPPYGYGYEYHNYYSGSGFTLNPTNPATSASGSPITTTFAYTDIASAVQTCATLTYNDVNEEEVGGADTPYGSFALWFLTSQCTWTCVQDPAGASTPSVMDTYFNVANADAAVVYGYTFYRELL